MIQNKFFINQIVYTAKNAVISKHKICLIFVKKGLIHYKMFDDSEFSEPLLFSDEGKLKQEVNNQLAEIEAEIKRKNYETLISNVE
jgi:hypothetical protein